jgi:hypothetical protein
VLPREQENDEAYIPNGKEMEKAYVLDQLSKTQDIFTDYRD